MESIARGRVAAVLAEELKNREAEIRSEMSDEDLDKSLWEATAEEVKKGFPRGCRTAGRPLKGFL